MTEGDGRLVGSGDSQLVAVMRDAPIGMMVVDQHDRVMTVNRAMCEMLGRSEAELSGTSWRDFTHPDDRDVGAEEIADLFAGKRESFAVEKRYLRPDGDVRWALTSVSLIRDGSGEPQHRITQHVDITYRRRWEAELGETASVQAKAIDELRRLEDAKSEFLTAVSHELRTPLTVINGLAETLARLGKATPPDVRRRLEDVLVANTRRMASLLDDLLDLDRLTAGGLTLDPTRIDIVDHVRKVIDGSTLGDRTVLDGPETLPVMTDPDRVSLILSNLLGNVVKYAPTGPVTVSLSPLDGGGFRLEVADRGPGIPSGQRETVFQPFHRLAVDHPNPGTGIGLSLVARFAAWHGGDASIIDSDIGTHVVVNLPDLPLQDVGREAVHAAAAEFGPDQPEAGTLERERGHGSTTRAEVTGRILVVDDDPQVRAMFRAALAYAGHEVSEAGDAQTAHDILAERTFDLALLDMDLSDSSGAGVASLIRADTRHAAMRIVFVSGDTTLEAKLAGLSAGGSDYLTKPVPLRELLGRVDAHLRDRLTWNDRLQTSLRERTQLASRVLDLRGLADLPSIVAQLRGVLETSFPVDDLTFNADRRATFAITGRADRPTIRLPLAGSTGPIGALELTTSKEHAQEAATILSDLGPHIAVVTAEPFQADLNSKDARGWLRELAGVDGLTTAVQPVVALNDGTTVGYEALARFPDGRRPDLAIAAAWRQGIGIELETLAIQRHIEAARHLPPDAWLALNVSGQTLTTLTPELLGDANRDIVLELTEHEPVDDYQVLRDCIAALPRTRLAVDDAGAGYASLRHIYELRPSLIKVDRTWISGCHSDPVRQTLIRGLVDLSASMGAAVVAEGIEHGTELEALRSLGVPLGQGFLLGRPFDVARTAAPSTGRPASHTAANGSLRGPRIEPAERAAV